MPGLVNAISPPLKPSSPLEFSVLPKMQQSFSEGVSMYAQNKSDKTLCDVVTILRDIFPKLSFWERFKDFFGLSDTADNRRDTTILYAASMLTTVYISHEYDDDVISQAFARQLQEVGLAPVQENARMENLVAEVLARLLDRNPQLADLITLQETNFTTTSGPETVSLCGVVSFGSDRINVPEFLKEMRLPFQTRAVSPLLFGNTLHDHLRRCAEDEGGRALATLFNSLPPGNQLQLQLQSWSLGFPAVALFSVDGLLAGMASVPVGTTTQTVSEWNNLEREQHHMYCTPDSGQACAVMMPFGIFKHKISNIDEMLNDMHRGGLQNTDVVVNSVLLQNETLKLMQTEALKVQEEIDDTPGQRLRDLSRNWTVNIQKDLNTDDASAQRVAAAVMYMIYQAGAGIATTGLLVKAAPPLLKDSKEKVVLHIDTRSGEGMLVAQAQFCSGKRSGGGDDSRAGAVVFRLPEPESRVATAADMAAGFTRKNIRMAGFGVRYPDMPAFPGQFIHATSERG